MPAITLPRLLAVAAVAIVAPIWGAVATEARSEARPVARENEHAAPARDGGNVPGRLISYPTSDFVQGERGRPGGVLKVSVAADLPTLDFHVAAGGHWIGRILYDNLVYLDDRGNVTPWLAKSWEISADKKTYVFHLRDDVTFSDGTRFDAEAVRVNLARIRDPATKSAAGTSYIEPFVDGRVIDDFTYEAHLREPYSPFLAILANTFFGMISPKAIREAPEKLAERPITTGPFVIESYRRQQSIRFVRRKDYRWAPPFIRHEGPAYLDRIEIQFVPEAIVRYSSLAAGQFDVTLDAPPQSAPAIRADPSLVMVNRVMPGNTVRGPIFNVEKPPFDDVRVRKAFALAVDREGVAKVTGFGELYPESDFLSSNMAYYDPSFRNVLRYDPAEANRILDEAGWSDRDEQGYRRKHGVRLGAEVILSPNSAGGGSGSSELGIVEIQANVRKIGFELRIAQLPNAQRLALRSSGNYQAMGPSGSYAGNSPAALFLYYHGSQILTEQYIGQNLSRLHDPGLDSLLDRARRAHEPAELARLYSDVQRRLIELVPTVPLFDYQVLSAYRRDVKGILFDTSCNRISFTTAWLDRGGA